MGAPPFMWDDVEALRVARLVLRAGYRLDGPEFTRCGGQAERHTIRRFRRDVVGAVLERCGQMSETERGLLRRWPRFRAPRVAPASWRDGVSVAEVAAGRTPADAA